MAGKRADVALAGGDSQVAGDGGAGERGGADEATVQGFVGGKAVGGGRDQGAAKGDQATGIRRAETGGDAAAYQAAPARDPGLQGDGAAIFDGGAGGYSGGGGA